MFYSHTFLARKSPLGTVWIAAHLENRLRKSQVTVTDIPASVQYIMFPEVPIALRLSGHLLLGVVRIYSKKVEYLYQECRSVCTQFNSVFSSDRVNLPEDARCAPVQAVTLPETFELDAIDIDDFVHIPDGPDNHLKPLKEITLDQAPIEGVAYISIFLDEDNGNATPLSRRQSAGAVPMEEDTLPPFPNEIAMEVSPELRRGQNGASLGTHMNNGNIPEVSPDFGVMRGAGNNMGLSPEFVVMRDAGHNIGVSPDFGVMRGAGNNNEGFPEFGDMPGVGNNIEVTPDIGVLRNEGNDMDVSQDVGGMRDGGFNPEVSPDFGVMRDAGHGFEQVHMPELVMSEEAMQFRHGSPENQNKRKRTLSPIRSRLSVPGADILPPAKHQNRSTAVRMESPDLPNIAAPLGHSPLGLELPPSPPATMPQPAAPALPALPHPNVPQPAVKARRVNRRRKNRPFDEERITLTNVEMKKQLNDRSDIVRSKEQKEARQLASSSLDVWKLRRIMQKEKMFEEPLLSGLSNKLQKVFHGTRCATRAKSTRTVPEAVNEIIGGQTCTGGRSDEVFAGRSIHSPAGDTRNDENVFMETVSPTNAHSPICKSRQSPVEDTHNGDNSLTDMLSTYSPAEDSRVAEHTDDTLRAERLSPILQHSHIEIASSERVPTIPEHSVIEMATSERVSPILEHSVIKMATSERASPILEHSPIEMARSEGVSPALELSPIEMARSEGVSPTLEHSSIELARSERLSPIPENSPIEMSRSDVHADEWTGTSRQWTETSRQWTETSRGSPSTTESATPVFSNYTGTLSIEDQTVASTVTPWTANTDGTVCPSNTNTFSTQERTTASTVTPWTANTDGTGSVLYQFDTSLGRIDERPEFDPNFSDIPTILRSPTPNDLNFLEADGIPSSPQNKTYQLSARTRAVANYLKECSPEAVDKTSTSQPGFLSLNSILEGKTRRQCARMFYETLVLKSCDYIGVKQEKPYDVVYISLTSAISKLRL